MLRILILSVIIFITACQTRDITKDPNNPGSTDNSAGGGNRVGRPRNPNEPRRREKEGSDTMSITWEGTVPVAGRNENGVRKDLEGTWVLESMEGFTFKETSKSMLEELRDARKKAAEEHATERDKDTKIPPITPPQGEKLHVPDRPSISFFGQNETFAGFTGCNKFTGRYKQKDSTSINVEKVDQSTRMVCMGEFAEEQEKKYLSYLKDISSFKSTGDRLELLVGGRTVLTYRRTARNNSGAQ